MKFVKKYWIIIIIILALLVFAFARAQKSTPTKKSSLYTVKRQTLTQSLTLSGKIDASEKAALRFQTSGRLSWVGVKEGEKVAKYQSLASLDQRDVKAALQKKLNTYLDTRYTFDQTNENYRDEIVDDSLKRILDKSQLGLSSSVLDVEIQHLAIEYANLWTPIAGIVTSIGTKIAGINITPATAEFTVINPESVYLSVTADQSEISKMHEGMVANLTFDAYPDEQLAGSVSAIAFTPKSGGSSTVYEVKVSLPNVNTDYKYRIDMTADALFTLSEKPNTLAIPTSAITTKDGKHTVQKVSGKSTNTTPVTLGDEYDAMTEIKSGLSEGDVIND